MTFQTELAPRQPPRDRQASATTALSEWSDRQLYAHAWTCQRAFADTLDAQLFQSLDSLQGCVDLIIDITTMKQFVPMCTLLAGSLAKPVGVIQSMINERGHGVIMNLAVVPEWRGRGIGTQLLQQAVGRLKKFGCKQVKLEVTARNHTAFKLYEKFGFTISRSYLRVVERAP